MIKKNYKGLSTIISTTLLILLVVVSVAMIWYVVRDLIKENIKESESCFGILDKITINSQYTCYNSSTNSKELRLSIDFADIEADELLISLSNNETSKSFKILKSGSSYDYLRYYKTGSIYGDIVTLPEKNEGITYLIKTDTFGVENTRQIKIAPIINENQCEVSDILSEIDNCVLLGS